MSENPYAKYAQPQATPKPKNPYAKYAPPQAAAPAPAPEPAQPERMPLLGQLTGAITEGVAGLPGLPLDAGSAIGNFAKRQFDMPEVPLSETSAKDWGSKGWSDWAFAKAGGTKIDAPTTETERLVQKAGLFFGGGVPFGPAGLVPTATAYAGSEVGRKADEIAPEYTKGYGEVAGALAGGVAGSARRAPVRSPAPSTAQLKSAANALYKQADDAGVILSPDAMKRLYETIGPDVADFGYDANLHPQIGTALKRIEDAGQGNATLKHLDILRRVARNAGQSPLNPSQGAISGKIVSHIDDFIDNLQPADVVSGDAAAAGAALKEARSLWSRMTKSEKIEAALENADNMAGSTYSGGNIDNATRQRLRPMIMRGNKQSKGWTPDEKAMLRKVVRGGGVGQNALRGLGKLSPESGFGKYVLTGLGAGSLMNPAVAPMLGVSAAGFAAKRIADAMTRGNVENLLDTVRRGGKAYQPRTPRRMLTRAAAAVPGATQDR